MQFRLTLNLQPFCLSLLRAETINVHPNTWLKVELFMKHHTLKFITAFGTKQCGKQ